ncbi:dihydroorotase family protein [Streptomyces sp. NPDC101225]|uniref:dihydroorotase n=1 Tax=Streptomyces sp. NPDC101225 TaxID=3366135 RepID=UPI00382ABDFB
MTMPATPDIHAPSGSDVARPHDLVVTGLVRGPGGDWARREIGVRDGVIAAIGAPGSVFGARTLDMGGALLLPGMVDAHVHSLSHSGEGVAAATRAAAAGGVTTIVEMPFDGTGPINSTDRLARKKELVAGEAHVDVALLGTVAPEGGWRAIDALRDNGVAGLKVSMFLTDPDRFPRISDPELINVFSAARANGLPVCVHAENDEVVRTLIGRLRAEGTDPLAHCRSRPPVSETLAVLTALELAAHTGVKLHVCHASLPRSVDLVRLFAGIGADATLETCPHYLLLDEQDMARRGARLKINPPLRTTADREGLWDRLVRGDIDVISSDHAPWPVEWKSRPNVFDNHSGAPGVETVYPLVLSEAHRRGPDVFDAAVRAMTTNPARRYGLSPKGQVAVGFDADMVAFDPDRTWVIDEHALHSNAGWSPYDGMTSRGRVVMTMVRGEVAYDDDLRAAPGSGRAVTPAF